MFVMYEWNCVNWQFRRSNVFALILRALNCPSLTNVVFRGVWVPFVSQSLHRLTMTLETFGDAGPAAGDARPTAELLAQTIIVPHARTLECLSLEGAFKSLPDEVARPPRTRVHMERLFVLEVTGTFREVVQMLDQFSIPSTIGVMNIYVIEPALSNPLDTCAYTFSDVIDRLGKSMF